jgi:hypothetical protein
MPSDTKADQATTHKSSLEKLASALNELPRRCLSDEFLTAIQMLKANDEWLMLMLQQRNQ